MAAVDRLGELGIEIASADSDRDDDDDNRDRGRKRNKSEVKQTEDEENAKPDKEISAHMALYDPIKTGLDKITRSIEDMETLKQRDKTCANEKERKKIMKMLDDVMARTTSEAQRIKSAMDTIATEDRKFNAKNKGSAKAQMRENMYQTYTRRFHTLMNEYNSMSMDFKKGLQDRTRRQLKIVDNTLSDEQVEKIVDSGQAEQVIMNAFIHDNMQDAIQEIEDRHEEILKLERQVQEVFELFKDLATLVDLQQESLDIIDRRVTSARDHVAKAEVELKQAEEYQKKGTKKQICILVVIVVILIIIIFPILAKSGSFSKS